MAHAYLKESMNRAHALSQPWLQPSDGLHTAVLLASRCGYCYELECNMHIQFIH